MKEMRNQRHPSEATLALLAGRDCGTLRRLFLQRHVRRCGDCRDTVASFGELRAAVREHLPSEVAPPELDWNRMAAEMKANIRVGLAAGECVGDFPGKPVWGWKPRLAVGVAGVLLLAGTGVFLRGLLPREKSGMVPAAVAESTGAGVEVRTDAGSSMTLLNHGDAASDRTVTSQGAIRASYVDGNTGTVTITSVYVE
jgi:hypothetical protein